VNSFKIKTKANLGYFRFLLIAAIFGLALFSFDRIKAIDCDQLTGEDKDKCEALEKKAKAYLDLIEIKAKQQNTLKNQMALIDAEQAKNQSELRKTQTQALELSEQIGNLEKEIEYKENLIKYQQLILTGLIQSYYENYQEGILKIVLINKDFSDILNKADYVEQSSSRVSEVLRAIQEVKKDLEKEHESFKEKKEASEKLKEDLQKKSNELLSTEIQKQALLTQTRGEEAKYQQLLARVEQQKLELFNFSSAENLGEVSASVKNYPKPDSKYWASLGWFYYQTDSRWGDKKIGNSNSLMKDYGCAVSAVSMVFTHQGTFITPGQMAKEKIFYYDLIKWPASWPIDIKLSSSTAHSGVDWKRVDQEIADGNPVIVYIKKTTGGGHYVVIHNKDKNGKYVVHDPYFGPNLFLDTSKSLVGKLSPSGGTVLDQMIIYKN